MRMAPPAIAIAAVGCGFDLYITVGADHRQVTLQQHGRPITYAVAVDETFLSMHDAQNTPMPFVVEDGAGVHTFDLSNYVACGSDDDPPDLELHLFLSYSVECPPFDPGALGPLRLCRSRARCGNVTSVTRLDPEQGL